MKISLIKAIYTYAFQTSSVEISFYLCKPMSHILPSIVLEAKRQELRRLQEELSNVQEQIAAIKSKPPALPKQVTVQV